ncbi:hypothetical protein C815_00946 [Firmicutes bacterium M10-2]|nr:hypothetical protein C815_00946 [Firmicutes bacterium M10-2]
MTNLENWTHRCIGELLESISLIQSLEETNVLYASERNQLVSAASEAARCLKEWVNQGSRALQRHAIGARNAVRLVMATASATCTLLHDKKQHARNVIAT